MNPPLLSRALPRLLIFALVLFFPSLRADAVSPPVSSNRGPFLEVGESWEVDSGLTITFLEVVSDTRRHAGPSVPRPLPGSEPRAMRSRKARGNAGILLRLEAGNQEPMTVRINTVADPSYLVIPENNLPDGAVGIPKSYSISVQKLLPEASKRGLRRAQSAYRLRLSVLVAW